MVDLDIPCPRCSEKLVLDESTAGQRVVCPACDALITMPALPSALKPPGPKSSLPAARPDGEQPRSHAIDTGLAFTPAAAPPASSAPTPAAPPPTKARRAVLPAGRKTERPLPDLTPAPYQPDLPPTPVATRSATIRADLPAPRGPNEAPRLAPPIELDEPEVLAAPAPPARPAAPPPPPPPPAAPPPGNHPFGTDRKLRFHPQGAIDVDPEIKDSWGEAGDDSEARHHRGRRLMLWGTVIAVPLLVGVVWQTVKGRRAATTGVEPHRAVESATATEEVNQASEAVRKFLATTTVDERAQWVRHPEVTKARMETRYTPTNPLKPFKVLRFNDRSSEQTIDGATFHLLRMELDDFSSHAIAVERSEDGYKVDWESFASWSEIPWGEFLRKQPTEPFDFRVTLEIDDYYNFGYNDRTKLFCYRLADPENWAHCWGYCGIDSEVGMQINRMIRRQRQIGMNVVKTILKLRFKPEPEARNHNQVLIEAVVQDGWVTAKP